MIRTWLVRPDEFVSLDGGDEMIGVVSDAALAQAMQRGAAVLGSVGGHLAVSTTRARTGVPNEMVTIAAVVRWQDRADNARPQAEQELAPLPVPHEVDGSADYATGGSLPFMPADGEVVLGTLIVDDDEAPDEDSIPAHLRG